MTHALVGDDTESGRYPVKELLEGHGYRVTVAGNGVEALGAAYYIVNPPNPAAFLTELAAAPVQLDEAPRQDAGVTADLQQARAILRQLAVLLAADDAAAVDLFVANQPLLLASFGAAAAQLGQLTKAFDYPAALAVLSETLPDVSER